MRLSFTSQALDCSLTLHGFCLEAYLFLSNEFLPWPHFLIQFLIFNCYWCFLPFFSLILRAISRPFSLLSVFVLALIFSVNDPRLCYQENFGWNKLLLNTTTFAFVFSTLRSFDTQREANWIFFPWTFEKFLVYPVSPRGFKTSQIHF